MLGSVSQKGHRRVLGQRCRLLGYRLPVPRKKWLTWVMETVRLGHAALPSEMAVHDLQGICALAQAQSKPEQAPEIGEGEVRVAHIRICLGRDL